MRYRLVVIISFVSVLNGCAMAPVDSESKRQETRDQTQHAVKDNSTEYTNTVKPRQASVSGSVLRIDGESVILGESTGTQLPLNVYLTRIQQRMAVGDQAAVDQLVRTYPDLAERAVLSPTTSLQMQQNMALWLDRLAAPAKGGWSILVADRQQYPERYDVWQRDRSNAWLALRRGEFEAVSARQMALPDDSQSPWPAISTARTQATAALAAGRPADAALQFRQIAYQVQDWDRRTAARACLFASLAYSLSGQPTESQQMRSVALSFLSLQEIYDPMLLRLLLETQSLSQSSSPGMFSTRAIRARLGRIELQRGAPQAALLALRTAETELGNEPSRERLRIGQAESLIALGQDEAAIAILVGLARTELRPEALVMLGLVQLNRGQISLGLQVLREAVDSTDAKTHPQVYADVAFAMLSAGENMQAEELLQQARDAYLAQNNIPALQHLLNNQLLYAQAIGDRNLVQETLRLLHSIEQSIAYKSSSKPSSSVARHPAALPLNQTRIPSSPTVSQTHQTQDVRQPSVQIFN